MKTLYYSFLFLLIPFIYSCENEPISKTDPSLVIEVNSELYNLIQKAAGNDFENDITCIDFNYGFTLVIYDENMDIIAYQIINNDVEFSDFLGNLEEGKSISLSYPITSVLGNGETYTINNNEELKVAIDKCLEADTIATCNNILTQTSCNWKIVHLDGPNNEYEEAYFEVRSSGNAGLYFQDHSYGGTWITYYIERKVHLNIFITGDDAVSTVWNFDWKVVSLSETSMVIDNGINKFELVKGCIDPCIKFIFEECEISPDVAIFDLESYFECFFPYTGLADPSTASWKYYKTYEDMEANIDPIADLMYTNTINPEVIYVRFENINTGEFITAIPIILKAIKC